MKAVVRVPATVANLGCGFDSFALALPIYNTIILEETVMPGRGIEINVLSEHGQEKIQNVPTDKSNIIYKAIDLLYSHMGQVPSELKITVKTGIPTTRGLGSSASVVIGGLVAANELLGRPADSDVILSIAAEVEGHPDNAVAAFVGGVTISSQEENGSVIYRKLPWPKEWRITTCVPDYELSTGVSRSVLPDCVPMKDAVHNLKRSAMFVEAVHTKDLELMKLALKDKLHEPYREKLVPGMKEIKENLKHMEGMIGCTLAGAGPSLLVISENKNLEEIKEIISNTWNNININSKIQTYSIEETGTVIE